MHTHIALLRGVMPGGKNAIKMADLRQILGEHGFANVRTWIQSGNVILETPLDAAQTAERIHSLLHSHLGADIAVIVKSRAELQTVLDKNPFAGSPYDRKRVFFTLGNAPLADPAGLNSRDFGAEKLHISPHAAYMYIPGDASRSTLGNVWLDSVVTNRKVCDYLASLKISRSTHETTRSPPPRFNRPPMAPD